MTSQMTNCVLICLLCVLQLSTRAGGFANGGPTSACLSLFPHHHGAEKQTTQAPYSIQVSSDSYAPLQTLNVTLSGIGGRTFKGIMVRVHRQSGDTEEILGSFTDFPKTKILAYDCYGGFSNVITHKNSLEVTEIRVKWVAPDSDVGNITIEASFVEDFDTFWAGVKTSIPSALDPMATPQPIETVSETFTEISYDGCGSTKGCFLYPRYCTGTDCIGSVTYETSGNFVTFELMADTTGYVSLGLSPDRMMGHDETISCTAKGEWISLQHGYNPALYNQRQYKKGLKDMETKQIDGKTFCRFSRPIAMSVYSTVDANGSVVFNLSNPYYIMLAWGKTYRESTGLKMHVVLPPVTENMVDFQVYIIHRGDSLPKVTQIHGILMLIAWTFFAGIATVIARYFRDSFDGRKWCGTKIWFQIHRASASLVFLLTAISFILIFVKVDGLSEAAKIHSYLGISVMAIVSLQLVGGLLRPAPDSALRMVFNWCHLLMGKAAQIVAAVTLFFAYTVKMLPYSQRKFGIIALAVWAAAQIIAEIVFETWRCTKQDKGNRIVHLQNGMRFQENKIIPTSRTEKIRVLTYTGIMIVLFVPNVLAIVMF